MRSKIISILSLLSLSTAASTINLDAGQSIRLESNTETTVTCSIESSGTGRTGTSCYCLPRNGGYEAKINVNGDEKYVGFYAFSGMCQQALKETGACK